MSDVFISYSRKNTEFVRKLVSRLNETGRAAWVDWKGIPLSAPNWWREVQDGIEKTNNFLFILSPDSFASPVCHLELNYALRINKRVIVVVHQEVDTSAGFAVLAAFQPDDAMLDRLGNQDLLMIARSNWQRISHINWDFFRETDDFEVNFQELVNAAETDLSYLRDHTRYLVRSREWQERDHRPDLLLYGEEIALAESWLRTAEAKVQSPPPNDLHRAYIRASRAAEKRRQWTRRSVGIGVLLLLGVAIATGLYSINVNNQANEARIQATFFSVVQNRIATLAAGGALISASTQTPAAFLATLTAVADHNVWEPVIQTDAYGVEMVMVPAGCFFMGSVSSAESLPVHEVCFDKPYLIDRFEVTQGQFTALNGQAAAPNPWEEADAPRTNITWYEAHTYCTQSRQGRLPKETEWEYAARGPDSLRYPWGNNFPSQAVETEYVIYHDNSGAFNTFGLGGRPGLVGENQREAGQSWVGAYDMVGNVWEFTNTIFDLVNFNASGLVTYNNLFPYPYLAEDGRETYTEDPNYMRVYRGGSFVSFQRDIDTTNRSRNLANLVYPELGFRCARNYSPPN
ncbi:MAG: hypothetical protein OHK0046_00350 [Anaerolineae bacterium]